MLRDERLEIGDEVGSPTQGEPSLEALLERRQPELLQPVDRRLGERLVHELGERRPLPEGQRLLEAGERGLRRPVRERLPCLLDEPREAQGIHAIGLDAELVARRAGDDGLAPEELP